MRLPALLVACALLLGIVAAPADAKTREPRAVLAFLPAGGQNNPKPVLDRLEARTQLAIGLMSATQGRYTPQQEVLDISAGARTSAAVYDPRDPPQLQLVVGGDGSGFIFGWSKVLKRARTALAEIKPGALTSQIPGGVAYAGVAGRSHLEAVVAADVEGNVAHVSLGTAATLADRVKDLLARRRFVVAGLPTADKGDAALDRLLRAHVDGDLLLVLQTPPRARVPQLLPAGALGVPGGNGALTSGTTRLPGIFAGIDVPVTVLERLGLAVPPGVRGQPIRATGMRDAEVLKTVEARLRVVSGRRTPTLAALLFAWMALVLALGVARDRAGVRAGLRIGSLGMLWVLPMLLVTGWLAPGRLVEVAIVVIGAFGLGALTDRFLAWPRGPLLPTAVTVVAYCADLVAGSPLIIRSLLGVNPRSGSRFYGLGNELESTLTVVLLLALGTLLWGRGRSRAGAAVFALAGVIFGVFVGAGQLGADVGGVITAGSGIAAATILMLPGKLSRPTIAAAALVPIAAVVALAMLDLLTGGNGHFTRTILKADSFQSLLDVIERRYTLAFNVLSTGAMPLVTIVTALAVAYAVRYRDRIYAPLRDSAPWRAALIGGLTASIIGALTNDSGPLLFVFGVFILACATAYIRGDPRLDAEGRMP
jgi:hypothetical protein